MMCEWGDSRCFDFFNTKFLSPTKPPLRIRSRRISNGKRHTAEHTPDKIESTWDLSISEDSRHYSEDSVSKTTRFESYLKRHLEREGRLPVPVQFYGQSYFACSGPSTACLRSFQPLHFVSWGEHRNKKSLPISALHIIKQARA